MLSYRLVVCRRKGEWHLALVLSSSSLLACSVVNNQKCDSFKGWLALPQCFGLVGLSPFLQSFLKLDHRPTMAPLGFFPVIIAAIMLHLGPLVLGVNQEGLALLAFKQSLSNPSLLGNWNPIDETPCYWTGVQCNLSSHLVEEISLGFLPLQGRLTPELRNLSGLLLLNLSATNLSGVIPQSSLPPSLHILDLSTNSLSGSIPDSIGELSALQELYLNDNSLAGHIPHSIGGMKSVRLLCLHDNNLTGAIPAEVGKLESLEILRLGGNWALGGALPSELGNCRNLSLLGIAVTSISGSIPTSFGALSKLQTLSLYSTKLSGAIPAELGNCRKLQSLYLHQNSLQGVIPAELGMLQELSEMLLWGNELRGSIPPLIGNCSSLITLDLSINQLSGTIPTEIGQLQLLEQLFLSDNNLNGSIPTELGSCKSLTDIQFDKNAFSGFIPPSLGQLSQLRTIFLWQNSLSGPIPASLGNCSNLQAIDFSHNKLSDAIPKEVFQLPKLEKLLLLSNSLSGSLSPDVGRCVSLVRLRLASNSLTGNLPREIGLLLDLTFLDLYNNRFTGELPSEIGNCTSLQLLDIHNNSFSGRLPQEIGFLRNLQQLDLSHNAFSTSIPSQIGRLGVLSKLLLNNNAFSSVIPADIIGCKKLTLLDLSHNQLVGLIPKEIGNMTSLEIALDLSWNSLSGEIPHEFSQLTQLQSLDISHNELSGSLQVLGWLDSLTYLNISVNQFTGNLPNTPFFRTLSPSAHLANPGLCDSAACSNSGLPPSKRSTSKSALVICFLTFAAAAILFGLGLLLVVRTQRMDPQMLQEMDSGVWPWSITYFQKLSFSIDDVLDKLTDENIIGRGYSGVVYRVELPNGGGAIAVKKLLSSSRKGGCGGANPSDSHSGSQLKDDHHPHSQHDEFQSEIETLGRVRHRNIVRLLGYCTNRHEKLLLYDYMPNGSLATLLFERKGMLDWDIRYMIILGAAQGLAYLHHDCAPTILHRDVKPNNILLDSRYQAYLGDFGLAKLMEATQCRNAMSSVAGSYGYIAPEYGYATKITEKSDVYSYGVVVLEVLSGRRSVEASRSDGLHIVDWVRMLKRRGQATIDILDPRLRGMSDPLAQEMEQALGVALLCVNPNPNDRPTMKDVVALLLEIKNSVEDSSTTKFPLPPTNSFNSSTLQSQ